MDQIVVVNDKSEMSFEFWMNQGGLLKLIVLILENA